MAKRKVEDSESEVDASDAGSVSDAPKPKKAKKEKVVKEKKEKPKKEKAPPKAKGKAKAKEAAPELFVALGPAKRVVVRKYQDAVLIDIREYYEDKETGDRKPGKKGISLTGEQWTALKESFDEVDKFVAELDA